MSPSEDELRAALREGQDGGLDADAVIRHAHTARRARRVRFATTAGAVIVVAGIGAGAAALAHHDGSGPAPAAQPPGRASVATPAPGHAGVPAAGVRSADPSQCPVRPERLMLPGGGGTGQFGGDGPLFTATVNSLLACGYRGSGPVRAVQLTGDGAQSVADGLDAAVAVAPGGPRCSGPSAAGLVLRAPGQPDVVVTFSCAPDSNQATNGTAVRYDWHVPPSLLQLVAP
ncbi:MAG: hypothetical protein EPN43_03340 [Jatrophihabitans sp.]|nr:MAG: hypothetical protein EPN43_03340 [Jatrophihabitans sp.]